jgi:uncharacterized protein
MSTVSFLCHGDRISGNFFTSTKATGVAFLLIQGWMGSQNIAAAQSLADLGFTSMSYDMRGNGSSEGDLEKLFREDFISDAVVAYDYLARQVDERTAIGVVGSSFGAYTALLLSKQRPVVCLSLRVPANYPDEEGFESPQLAQMIDSRDFVEWRTKQLNYSENRALTALHAFNGKVQIVESGADEAVSHQTVKNYVDSVQNVGQLEYVVMKDAPHSLRNEVLSAKYVNLLSGWARQFLAIA